MAEIGYVRSPGALTRLLHAWLFTVIKPARAFELILRERSLWLGFASVLLYGSLNTVTAIVLTVNGLQPSFEPLLPISKEKYYLGQVFSPFP
jgi:hypothetical protein